MGDVCMYVCIYNNVKTSLCCSCCCCCCCSREKQHTFVASRLGSRPLPAQPKGSSRGQVVLFTNDPKITAAHKDLVRVYVNAMLLPLPY